jgi:uncharacterized protein (DUF924 family)
MATVKLELLIELFCEWYAISQPQLRRISFLNDTSFSDLWANKWFAKKGMQKFMDEYLIKYEILFDLNMDDIGELTSEYKLIVQIAFMILWDQVSRNIYRNTKKAYATDCKARAIVDSVVEQWDRLPLAVKVSCILVYIHSENMTDLEIVKILLSKIDLSSLPSIKTALHGIAKNHSDRMKLFGRIPERNKYLGRESTASELAYMLSFS